MIRRFLALGLAIGLLLVSAAPTQAHSCEPPRDPASAVISNYYRLVTGGAARFEGIEGRFITNTNIRIQSPDYSFVVAEMVDHDRAGFARGGWRFAPNGDAQRFWTIIEADGDILRNGVWGPVVDHNDVGGAPGANDNISIEASEELGKIRSIKVIVSGMSVTQSILDPFARPDFEEVRFMFRSRNIDSQFFGNVSDTHKWGVDNVQYASQFGSDVDANVTALKDHFYGFARQFKTNVNSFRMYDEDC